MTTHSRIELQIGEQTFHTTRKTLSESPILKILTARPPPYFLDADPSAFEHILRYLRTGTYPLFHDPQRGHDIHAYHTLLLAARFYQLSRLTTWLERKGYLAAVSTRTRAGWTTVFGDEQMARLEELLLRQKSETLRIVRVKERIERHHQCPQAMWRHTGRRKNCEREGCLSQPGATGRRVPMRILEIEYVVNATETKEEELIAGRSSVEVAEPPPYQDF